MCNGKREGKKYELLLIVVLKNAMSLCYVMNLYNPICDTLVT